jgi:hypothetical protein
MNDNWEGRLYWETNWETGEDTFPLTINTTNFDASLQAGETAPCASTGATIWYEWWPDRTGTLTIDTAGSAIDTVLAVYQQGDATEVIPSPPGGNITTVACDDNALGLQSRVSIDVSPGRPLWIQVGGVGGQQGAIRINATCACAPPNDNYDIPGDLYVDEYMNERLATASTTYATTQPGEPRACGNIGATVWYSFYAPSGTTFVLDTAGSDFDTVVAVYRVDGWPPFPGATLVDCNDNAGGSPQARLTFTAESGSQYFVQAGGANAATGTLRLLLACDPACAPFSDNWGQYSLYLPANVEAATTGATLETGEPRPCGQIDKTVWYGILVQGDARVRIDAAGSSFPVALAAYETITMSPPPASFDLVECRASSGGAQPSLTFDARGRTFYWIQAGGVNGASGTLRLSFECAPGPCPPYNDSAMEPGYLSIPWSFPYRESFDVRGATTEHGEDLSCGNMGATAWIRIEPTPSTLPMRFATDNSSHETAIAVYEGPQEYWSLDSVESLSPIACSPGGDGLRASIEFTMNPRTSYYVQIGGRNGATSPYLEVTGECLPSCPPEHDNMTQPRYMDRTMTDSVDTRGATLDEGEPRPCEGIGKTVWYTVPESDVTRTFVFDTAGSSFTGVLATYASSGMSPPGGASPIGCAAASLTLEAQPGVRYLLQVGGASDTGGELQLRVSCTGCPFSPIPVTGGPGVVPDAVSPGGAIRPPDTGNGGYLPSRRQE